MEPLKSLIPFAKWLLRLTVAVLVYSLYFDTLLDFDLSTLTWFIALIMTIFAILLLAGGFTKKAGLTVTSALIIFILSIVMMFIGGVDLDSVIANVGTASIAFYFMARGNKG